MSAVLLIRKCPCGDRACRSYTVSGANGLHGINEARYIAAEAPVRAALDADAAGRPLEQLLREAALLIEHCGGGPLSDCLRMKADEVRAADAALNAVVSA